VNQFRGWPFRPIWRPCISAVFLPFLFAILLLAGLALGQPLQAAALDPGIALQEGVVIAPQQGFAYLMRPGGGIDAVDLASGALRWRTKTAAKPLALSGDRLVAQADSRGVNVLKLMVLDAQSGAVRGAVRIALPAGVAATVTDTPAGSFRVRAESQASKLVVHWEATTAAEPAQGYLPAADDGLAAPSKAKPSSPKILTGEAVVDLSAPSLKARPSPAAPSEEASPRPALEELQRRLVTAEGREFLSADGQYVLVTEPVQSAELTLYRHRWTVYERASGAKLGSVPALVAAAPFVVVGETLYHVAPAHGIRQQGRFVQEPAALLAVNLKTGVESWQKSIGETFYRGPFPP
jgi:hypothetical protein